MPSIFEPDKHSCDFSRTKNGNMYEESNEGLWQGQNVKGETV